MKQCYHFPFQRTQHPVSCPPTRRAFRIWSLSGLLLIVSLNGQGSGFLKGANGPLFPIGFYELPESDLKLQEVAASGVNLVQCRTRSDLDRVHALGLKAWVALPLQTASEEGRRGLQQRVLSLKDHPAIAVWEGPDEVVWNFTAYSGLFRDGTYAARDEWWRQTDRAIEFSESQAAGILPAIQENCQWIQSQDPGRPLWINEAAQSDMKFVRQYIDHIQITGCDTYPIHDTSQKPWMVGEFAERYQRIGRGRPVWMVLQGFSWHQLNPPRDDTLRYPTFQETRFMAYDVIVHGASGILYWGTQFVPKESAFLQSILAMTRELAALQPFLTQPNVLGVAASCLDANDRFEGVSRGVRCIARRFGSEWLLILVNEDAHAHLGVELEGLQALEGQSLALLYGSEQAIVSQGGFVTRLKPYEVKLFALTKSWENGDRSGREFGSSPP